MEHSIRDITKRVRSMALECTLGATTQSTEESGLIIKYMALEYTDGKISECTRENGCRPTCMAMGFTSGQMAGSTLVSSTSTRRKALEFIIGMMVECIAAIGSKESSMGLVSTIFHQKAERKQDYGRMGRE